jgi:hypothetical protein
MKSKVFNRGTSWSTVVSFTLRSLYSIPILSEILRLDASVDMMVKRNIHISVGSRTPFTLIEGSTKGDKWSKDCAP